MNPFQAIDMNCREFTQNPYPTYRALREAKEPFWLAGGDRVGTGGIWLFSRYKAVAEILRNTKSISKELGRIVPAESVTLFDRTLINADPPEHTRLRALIAPQFGVRRTAEREHRIEALVDSLLTGLEAKGQADYMADFASQLPVLVVGEIIGVPRRDAKLLKPWTDAVFSGLDSARSTPEQMRKAGDSLGELAAYLESLTKRTDHRPESVIGQLLRLQSDSGEPAADELLGTCLALVLAGYETTANLLGNGLLALFMHPEQMEALRREPELIASAVDEMLRYESPIQRSTFRVTTAACTIDGYTLEPGQQISAVLGAANHDPEQFDSPDTFDIRRLPNRHVAFGAGIHKCVGERLARTEARIAFRRLLGRFPRLRMVDDEPDWLDGTIVRGLATLRVELA